jgi:PAS domain S-box-containing protein
VQKPKNSSAEAIDNIARDPFDGLPIGLYRTSPEGQLLYANQALVEMMKFPDLETMKSVLVQEQYTVPRQRDEWKQILERDGVVTDFENLNRCYDGTEIWVRDNARAVRGPDGKTLYYEGALQDVTRRRITEERLARERTYFTQLFELAPEAIAMVDQTDSVLMINSEFSRMFGYSAAEAVGKKLNNLVVPDDLKDEGMHADFTLQSGSRIGFESYRKAKDGRRIPVSVLARPFALPGEETGIYVIYRDITERQQALEALRKSEDRFRSLIEDASEMVSIFDSNGRRTYASPATIKTLGYTMDELRAQNPFDHVHPDDVETCREMFFELSRDVGGTRSLDFRFRRKDGEWRMLSTVGKNLSADPAVGGIVINTRDITDQHNLADQLRRAQKMEAVGRLAGGVAHDFNNLLTVISTYTDFILGDEDLKRGHRDDLQEIKKASDRAAGLTRQLLAFSRSQVLQPRILNLNSEVEDIRHMLERVLPANIDVRIKAQHNLWMVKADHGQMEQVVLNLALNARDAMPDGGTLTFTTSNQRIEFASSTYDREFVILPGEYVALTVTDTGVGMDRTTERKIFEPFFTTKGIGKGTGLGLATVYGIVKQTGGHINVDTELGKGTTFRILLPRAHGALESDAQKTETAQTRRLSATILIAEDEDPVRGAVERMLREEGYTVLSAANGNEALEIFEASKTTIDLLITDLVMPEVGGLDLAAKCRRARAGLPVIFMSGFTEAASLKSEMFSASEAFLEKPFHRETFLEKVREVLSARAEVG